MEKTLQNNGSVFLSIDTASFNDNPSAGIYKDVRDSIYIEQLISRYSCSTN